MQRVSNSLSHFVEVRVNEIQAGSCRCDSMGHESLGARVLRLGYARSWKVRTRRDHFTPEEKNPQFSLDSRVVLPQQEIQTWPSKSQLTDSVEKQLNI
jgi:hypothetical protein